MQNYQQLYFYIHEYQKLIYDVYSKNSISFLVTYYNINEDTTIWDDQKSMGGYYEKIGELSGVHWNRFVLLPIFFVTEIQTQFDGIETGLIKNNEAEIVIPSSYGIQPYFNDIVKFETDYLMTDDNITPVFSVSGIEKSANTNRTFWKLKLRTEQSVTTDQVNQQVSNSYVFFDYTKNIYEISDGILLTKLLQKNEKITETLNIKLFNQNSGFYFV
jgi:hypothetical protein